MARISIKEFWRKGLNKISGGAKPGALASLGGRMVRYPTEFDPTYSLGTMIWEKELLVHVDKTGVVQPPRTDRRRKFRIDEDEYETDFVRVGDFVEAARRQLSSEEFGMRLAALCNFIEYAARLRGADARGDKPEKPGIVALIRAKQDLEKIVERLHEAERLHNEDFRFLRRELPQSHDSPEVALAKVRAPRDLLGDSLSQAIECIALLIERKSAFLPIRKIDKRGRDQIVLPDSRDKRTRQFAIAMVGKLGSLFERQIALDVACELTGEVLREMKASRPFKGRVAGDAGLRKAVRASVSPEIRALLFKERA